MTINLYTVTLKHDSGLVDISVAANRMTQAIRIVLKAELAPFGAVTGVSLTKRGN